MFAKRIKVLILLLFAITTVRAQDDVVSKFFSEYARNEHFTNVTISSKMFSLFTHIDAESEEDKEMLQTMSKLKGLRMLAADSIPNAREFYKEAIRKPGKSYEELMTVSNPGGEEMLFLIRESEGRIAELVMIIGGDEAFFIMSIFGDVDLKQISKLSKGMNINGMNYLENLDTGSIPQK